MAAELVSKVVDNTELRVFRLGQFIMKTPSVDTKQEAQSFHLGSDI